MEDYGPYIQGKTCKYCPRCQIIMCHQDELEFEMAVSFEKIDPAFLGNEYLVLGTVETRAWKAGMVKPVSLEETLAHAADFKKYMDFQFDPGGWRPRSAGPGTWSPARWTRRGRSPPATAPRRGMRRSGGGMGGRSAPEGLPPRGPGAAGPA